MTVSRYTQKAGTFSNVTCFTLPSWHSALIAIRPAGASSTNSVTGSCIGIMPVSSSTVATAMVLPPLVTGYSTCSMMMKPAAASGCFGGTIRLQHNGGYPRGSRSISNRSWSSFSSSYLICS
jgi:hypothetical protein